MMHCDGVWRVASFYQNKIPGRLLDISLLIPSGIVDIKRKDKIVNVLGKWYS